MNISNILKILQEKERRVERQKELLTDCGCLISFTLNIPGPVKVSALYEMLFEEGKKRLREAFSESPSLAPRFPGISEKNSAGYVYFLPVDGKTGVSNTHGLAVSVKRVTAEIENRDPLGRLFDIDVLTKSREEGTGIPKDAGTGEAPAMEGPGTREGTGTAPEFYPEKVSREELSLPKRKCLICGNDAFVCLRAARHNVPEVLMCVTDILLSSPEMRERIFAETGDFSDAFATAAGTPYRPEKTARIIATEALRAVLYEVITTPKPGLVDAENNGSHSDMDITTFFDSAVAIAPYFEVCAAAGRAFLGEAPEDILEKIRPLGLLAERRMYEATYAVNTHKGAIFTLGILCTAAGRLASEEKAPDPEELLLLAGRICGKMPNGGRGIRAEAMNGYPSVRKAALPALSAALGEKTGEKKEEKALLNEAGVHALIALICTVDDANIERRCMCDGKVWARERAQYVDLQQMTGEAFLRLVSDLDREFVMRNASPGGSADLLAATYFLHFLEVAFAKTGVPDGGKSASPVSGKQTN